MTPLPRVVRGLVLMVLVAAVATALIVAAVRAGRLRPNTDDAGRHSESPVSPESTGIVCFGTVDLEHGVAALTAAQPGRVVEVLAEENRHVEEGAVLLRLEDAMAKSRLAEAEAAVELARSRLKQAMDQPGIHRIRIAQQQAMRDAAHSRVESARHAQEREERLAKGYDLRLIPWGNGVPITGQGLVIVGTDSNGLLRIRTFDSSGIRADTYEATEGGVVHLVFADASGTVLSYTPESSLPRAPAIADLKRRLPGLLPPHVPTDSEKARVLGEAASITGRTLAKPAILTDADRAIRQETIREAEAMERAEARRLAELEAQDTSPPIDAATVELKSAEARRNQARLAVEECRLKAPGAGTVLRIQAAPGDLIGAPGDPPAILFAADGARVIRATVEQEFADRVREGQPATIRDDADPDASWRGRVVRLAGWYAQRRTILHDPSQLSDVRTLECLIALDPGQPPLRLGQGVRVSLGPIPPDASAPRPAAEVEKKSPNPARSS